jgi:hypothetical protein
VAVLVKELDPGGFQRGADRGDGRLSDDPPFPFKIHNCGKAHTGRRCKIALRD